MTEKIYPTLPTAPSMNSPNQFHIDTVKKYYDELINLRNKYERKREKYSKKRERLSNASTSTSAISILMGVSAVGSSFTVVGLPLGSALTGISILLTGASSVLTVNSKKYNKKISKTVELFDALTTSIGKFELLISKSLTDGFIIDSNEFSQLQSMYFKVMNDIKNRDYKMKTTIEENYQKSIMEELKNLKNTIEKK